MWAEAPTTSTDCTPPSPSCMGSEQPEASSQIRLHHPRGIDPRPKLAEAVELWVHGRDELGRDPGVLGGAGATTGVEDQPDEVVEERSDARDLRGAVQSECAPRDLE